MCAKVAQFLETKEQKTKNPPQKFCNLVYSVYLCP